MRRPKIHRVTRGCLTGEGATKALAKADLEKQIQWVLTEYGITTEVRFGHVLILSAQPGGFQSVVLTPDDLAQHGLSKPCTCFHGMRERPSQLQGLRLHLAQSAWSLDCDDGDHMLRAGLDSEHRRMLVDWMNWQRRYARNIASGMTPNEAHHAASGLSA
jgi:hypothetical protein